MASIYDLKPKFQDFLRPLLTKLAALGVTANQVTIFACGLSIFTGLSIATHPNNIGYLLWLPAVLFVRMALNAIDGMLAREFNQQSKLGAILNELTDVISDAALYLPLAIYAQFSTTLIVLVVVLAVISEMTGVVAIQIGAKRQYQGPMGKSDRAFWLGLLALLVGLGVNLPKGIIDYALIIMIIMLIVTISNRASSALKEAQ